MNAVSRLSLALVAAVVAAAVVVFGSATAADARPAASDHPNVIVVMTDDENASDLRVMQNVQRRLVDRGVSFDHFYATFPLCAPSRASFLTGEYAHNHGVKDNSVTGGFDRFDDSATLETALHDAGYRTGLIGKYINGYPIFAREHPRYIPPGYDRWFVSTDKLMYLWGADVQGRLERFPGRRNYQTGFYAHETERFIRHSANSDSPFFLTVTTHAPHREHLNTWPNPRPAPRDYGTFPNARLPKPPSFNEADVSDKPPFLQAPLLDARKRRVLRRRYQSRLQSLVAVDRLVKRLVKQVHQFHETGDTWFIFTSDNGYMLGEHRLTTKNVLYEEDLHQPLVIRGPGVPSGEIRHQITGNIDLAPTILDIAGVAPPSEPDGISLLPLIADPADRASRDVLIENRRSQGVRTRGWTYIEHDTDGDNVGDEFELYDMRADPYELDNRYGDPGLATQQKALAARLDQLRHCAGHSGADPCD